jgi:hypothetical protein
LEIRDGNEEIRKEIPQIVEIIARTARWVNPETFRQLPVWCPYVARGHVLYDKTWTTQYKNTKRLTGETTGRTEPNIAAGKALVEALGITGRKPRNWSVCHIWGYDDPSFTAAGSIVRDPRYYSCLANMIWLPAPLKSFTDSLPEVKVMLRTCAFYLYDWACEHETVQAQADAIRAGSMPENYPATWPGADRKHLLPPGTAPFTREVGTRITRQKEKIKSMLADDTLMNFPRENVRDVLRFWKIEL